MLLGLLPSSAASPEAYSLNSFLLESMCPQCRSHWNRGLTPVLSGLTQHLHVAAKSTDTEHLVPESLLLWFFSPELTCQDWPFCDLPANLASPLSGGPSSPSDWRHDSLDPTGTQHSTCPQIWSRSRDPKSGMDEVGPGYHMDRASTCNLEFKNEIF